MKKLLTMTVCSVAVLASFEANASGFNLREQSAAAMANAFAGSTAGAEDVSYAYFNPAALSVVKDSQMSMGATYVLSTHHYKDAVGKNGTAGPENGSSVISHAVLPSFAYAKRINDKTVAGFSFNVPDGLATDYSANWAGSHHGTLTQLNIYRLTGMISYDALPGLTLAGGPTLQYASAILKNSTKAGNNARLDGDDLHYGYTLGALYRFSPQTRAGVAFRSEIEHKIHGGDIVFSNNLGGLFPNQGIWAELSSPAVLTFGVYHDINEQWAVMAEAQKTYWSSFGALDINYTGAGVWNGSGYSSHSVTEENWKDVWMFGVGTSYKYNDQWKFRTGVAFDQTPVSDRYRTPRIPDSDKWLFGLGAEYKYNDKWTFNGTYMLAMAEKAKINLPDADKGGLSTTYKGNIHLFGLTAVYNF